jgi:transcriptional regulator with XRE-family HTH domain
MQKYTKILKRKSFYKFFSSFYYMSKQTDALRAYFDARGIKQRDLADKLGLHEGTVSSILSGRYGISKGTAAKLAQAFGFNLLFLTTGQGELIDERNARHSAPETTRSADALLAENAELRELLEKKSRENDRLLGIIEKLTEKSA